MKGGAWWKGDKGLTDFSADKLEQLDKESSRSPSRRGWDFTDKRHAKTLYMQAHQLQKLQRVGEDIWKDFLILQQGEYNKYLEESGKAKSVVGDTSSIGNRLRDLYNEGQSTSKEEAKAAAEKVVQDVATSIKEQWCPIGDYEALKTMNLIPSMEDGYVGKEVFHKYYGKGKIVGYEAGGRGVAWVLGKRFGGRGWFVRFEEKAFKPYLYNFRFKSFWMKNNILVHKPTEYMLIDLIIGYNKRDGTVSASDVRNAINDYPFKGLDELIFLPKMATVGAKINGGSPRAARASPAARAVVAPQNPKVSRDPRASPAERPSGVPSQRKKFAEGFSLTNIENIDTILNEKGIKLKKSLDLWARLLTDIIRGDLANEVNRIHQQKHILHRLLIMFEELSALPEDENYIDAWIQIFTPVSKTHAVSRGQLVLASDGTAEDLKEGVTVASIFVCCMISIILGAQFGLTGAFIAGLAFLSGCVSKGERAGESAEKNFTKLEKNITKLEKNITQQIGKLRPLEPRRRPLLGSE
tara:strand:+ start:10819 stop:12390 length:1572 start_codon:yes stop_codon:yes gene_type:complete